MSTAKHPSYPEEHERCRYTLDLVESTLKSTVEKKERLDREVERIKKNFNPHSSQDYLDLTVNSLLQGSAGLKIRNLITARSKPYFARVDFCENGRDIPEKLYIGKMSLMREDDRQIVIVDWRAPIANLYYEGRLGKAAYYCPDGLMEGEMSLKRQFSINGGELQNIFDIDITTNDDFLQSYLGAGASSRLKEIVSTIQAEQNRIIRADMWTPLIVQGVAGSGKTTIALHRIAYLIYTHDKTFEPENFMIIAPTRFFLNYISEVLPELGVERVRQTTFEQIAMELIGKRFKVMDANEKLAVFVNYNAKPEDVKRNRYLKRVSEIKASMSFKELLDEYVAIIESSFIPEEDFCFDSKVIFTYDEINDLFTREYKRLPVALRINEIRKHLKNRLLFRKDEIVNHLHDACDRKVFHIKHTLIDCEARQQLIVETIDEKNNKIARLETYAKKAVADYVKKISNLSVYQYYRELYQNRELFTALAGSLINAEMLEFMREYTLKVLKSGYADIEDFAPMIYLKYRIHGIDEKIPVRHIVIDEAQDFSIFQFYVLKKIIKDSSFTILGDLNQGIHSYRGVKAWEEVAARAFEGTKTCYLTLEQSYRTSVEVMEAANNVIRKLTDTGISEAKPVIRHGEKVGLFGMRTLNETAVDLDARIDMMNEEGFKSMAVICKTLEGCKKLQTLLKRREKGPHILTGKDDEYRSGLVLAPSFLVKGLEFDVVFIIGADRDAFREDEMDIKLLYVAMTRALHRLYIYYTGELTPLLRDGSYSGTP